MRHNGQCKAEEKLHINGQPVREINEHTYPPSQDQTEVKKITASIKRRSQATHDTPQQILALPFRIFQKQLLSTCHKLMT